MPIRIRNLNHVSLQVKDVDKTIAFYRDVVGLPLLPRPDFKFRGAWFQIGGAGQELHLIDGAGAPVSSTSRGDHFAIMVESLDDVEPILKANGVKYTGPHHRPDGAKQIFADDPDGHVVEFCTAPGK